MNPLGQGLGTRLVDQLAPRLFTAAFAFWAGGLLALWTAGYGRSWVGQLSGLPTVAQLVWLAATVALVAGSAIVAELLTLERDAKPGRPSSWAPFIHIGP